MKHPQLEIRIASPCRANWQNMEGDARTRFCHQCRKHVYNLSALTAESAAELVRAKEGKLCARFYRRADGTLLHAEDCPVGFAARQWQRARRLTSAAVSMVLLVLGVNRLEAGSPIDEKKPPATPPVAEPLMGDVCVLPSPTPTPKPSPPVAQPTMGEICVVPTPTPKPTATPGKPGK